MRMGTCTLRAAAWASGVGCISVAGGSAVGKAVGVAVNGGGGVTVGAATVTTVTANVGSGLAVGGWVGAAVQATSANTQRPNPTRNPEILQKNFGIAGR